MNNECFELWALATYPLVQYIVDLDNETFDEMYSSHPAVAHFLDATREICDAVNLWRLDDC